MKQMRLIPRGHQYRNIMPCKLLERYQSFGVPFCPRLQDNCREITSSWTLEFIYQTTWCHQESKIHYQYLYISLFFNLCILIFGIENKGQSLKILYTVPPHAAVSLLRMISIFLVFRKSISTVKINCTNTVIYNSLLCKPISYYSRFYTILNVPLF